MGDPPRRQPSHTRLPIVEDIAPPPVARPVPRMQTPIGMPAPPPAPVERDRDSHDDLEQVLVLERLERERAQLLVRVQDAEDAKLEAEHAKAEAEREARRLREIAPVFSFPPPSLPPPPPSEKKSLVESAPTDIKALEKALLKSRWGKAATVLGILAAIGGNAFNMVRTPAPERVEAVRARVEQSDKERDETVAQATIERQRNLAALRALYCYCKQLRGASARQGLDLPSLPPGGVTALRLDQGDPSKPPAFVAAENCPTFPQLPPEVTGGPP